MIQNGINAARWMLSITFNAVGLMALLAIAWYLPQFLGMLVSKGLAAG